MTRWVVNEARLLERITLALRPGFELKVVDPGSWRLSTLRVLMARVTVVLGPHGTAWGVAACGRPTACG